MSLSPASIAEDARVNRELKDDDTTDCYNSQEVASQFDPSAGSSTVNPASSSNSDPPCWHAMIDVDEI